MTWPKMVKFLVYGTVHRIPCWVVPKVPGHGRHCVGYIKPSYRGDWRVHHPAINNSKPLSGLTNGSIEVGTPVGKEHVDVATRTPLTELMRYRLPLNRERYRLVNEICWDWSMPTQPLSGSCIASSDRQRGGSRQVYSCFLAFACRGSLRAAKLRHPSRNDV